VTAAAVAWVGCARGPSWVRGRLRLRKAGALVAPLRGLWGWRRRSARPLGRPLDPPTGPAFWVLRCALMATTHRFTRSPLQCLELQPLEDCNGSPQVSRAMRRVAELGRGILWSAARPLGPLPGGGRAAGAATSKAAGAEAFKRRASAPAFLP